MRTLLCFIFIIFLIQTANSTVFYVPSSYPTIHSALNSCNHNDTVIVSAGTYYENIIWPNTKGLKLLSVSGPDSTVIDGSYYGSVISITGQAIADPLIYIQGFTIQHGKIDSTISFDCSGAGIYLNTGNYFLEKVIIKENILNGNSHSYGSGLYINMSDLTLHNCELIQNKIDKGLWSYGGGLYSSNSRIAVSFCNISDNEIFADSWGSGGGINAYQSDVFVNHCIISGNESTSSNWNFGTGIGASGGTFSLLNTKMENNILHPGCSWGYGVAIDMEDMDSSVINNSLIINNIDSFLDFTSSGSAAFFSSSVDTFYLKISNCTIANNSNFNLNGKTLLFQDLVKANFQNNILWNVNNSTEFNAPTPQIQVNNCDIHNYVAAGINGNINSDPLFISSSDFHLLAGSPCLNAGTVILLSDLDGNPRPLPTGSNSDIGCYEMDEVLLSVNEIKSSAIEIFPNPVSTFLNVNIDKPFNFEIYNLTGQKEMSGFSKSGINNEINLSFIPEGYYIIKIQTTDGKLFSKEFLKN